jgi:hypothetical protein
VPVAHCNFLISEGRFNRNGFIGLWCHLEGSSRVTGDKLRERPDAGRKQAGTRS